MAKLTSKYQLSVPKAIAQAMGLKPGDELVCEPAGEVIRVRATTRKGRNARSVTDRLVLFDLATERQRYRDYSRTQKKAPSPDRGWTREELYET